MSRPAPTADKLLKVVEGLPNLIVDGSVVVCTVCEKSLCVWHKQHCIHHLKSRAHETNKQHGIPKAQFFHHLCVMFCSCNLSFSTLNNVHFRKFWDKYVPEWELPRANYIREYYIPRVYNIVMDNIRKDLIKKHVYVTVDETTDQHDNNVVHVLVRALDLNGISAPYLISSKRVDQTTAETITHIVGNALMNVGITTEQVLLFVTDAAAHMKNAGVRLKQIYPHMVHITCLTHGLHRLAEEIRKQYPAVDKFVFATKNLLSKASDHRRNFKRALPNIPLPTDPVCTRWGTWLKCVVYYAEHYEEIKGFLITLNAHGSKDVATSQRYCQDPDISSDIRMISERYSVLVSAIEKLEKEVTSLNDTLAVVDSVISSFSAHFDSRSIVIQRKLHRVLNNNPGYSTMCRIREELIENHESFHNKFYRYGPLTCVDVERSFSTYKAVLPPNRMSLGEKNTEYILVTMQYYQSLRQPHAY